MFNPDLFPPIEEKKEMSNAPAAPAAGAVPAPIDSALLKQGWINHLDKYPEQKEVWEYKTIPDDHSSLTMKFCCHLAFYTQKDADLMREIFEASPFAKCSNVANKWNDSSHILHGQQYADYHIQKAIAGCTDVYNPALSKAVVSTTDIVPRNKFPDVKLNQDGKPTAKPLATIENIKFLLDFYKIFVVNNVINKVTTITGTDT